MCSLMSKMVQLGSVGGVTGRHIFHGTECQQCQSELPLSIRLVGCLLLVEAFKPKPKKHLMLLKKEHKPQACNLPR